MSFLSRSMFRGPISRTTIRPTTILSTRSFHLSTSRAALSETDRNRDEDVASEIDEHKNDQLDKQKKGEGHWKGELASESEAAIKADRGEVDASSESISKLQKETEEFAEQQRKGKK